MGRPGRDECHAHHPRGRAPRGLRTARDGGRPGRSSRRRTSASTGASYVGVREGPAASRSSSTPARAASRSSPSSPCPGSSGAPRPGILADDDGFLHVDQQCKVTGVDDVWAAGDGIAFPVKFGGLAASRPTPPPRRSPSWPARTSPAALQAGAPRPSAHLEGRALDAPRRRRRWRARRGRRPRAVVAARQGRRPPSRPVPRRARRSRRRRPRAAGQA